MDAELCRALAAVDDFHGKWFAGGDEIAAWWFGAAYPRNRARFADLHAACTFALAPLQAAVAAEEAGAERCVPSNDRNYP